MVTHYEQLIAMQDCIEQLKLGLESRNLYSAFRGLSNLRASRRRTDDMLYVNITLLKKVINIEIMSGKAALCHCTAVQRAPQHQ